jgi:hypothetical protein
MVFSKLISDLNQKADAFLAKEGIGSFHLWAQDALVKSRLHETFDFHEVIKHSFQSSFPIQNFKSFEFSDLPFTLSRGKHCFIDLYCWQRRPTTVHDHHFSGAFLCLEGQNQDLHFEFQERKRWSSYYSQGNLLLTKTRELKRGDAVAIAPLDQFIHQNHHHGDLTINLTLRTPDLGEESLSNYFYSGLKQTKNPFLLHRTERLLKILALGLIDTASLDITQDDAITFLIRTYGTESQNESLLELRQALRARIQQELAMNIDDLILEHEKKMDDLYESY